MVIQEANSGVVQKVQPNDKSGKLLPNNHTQGRKRAPGHLMSKGLACGAPRNDLTVTLAVLKVACEQWWSDEAIT